MNSLKEELVKAMNDSQLSLECVYYVLKDLYRDMEKGYLTLLQQQKEEVNNKTEEEEK